MTLRPSNAPRSTRPTARRTASTPSSGRPQPLHLVQAAATDDADGAFGRAHAACLSASPPRTPSIRARGRDAHAGEPATSPIGSAEEHLDVVRGEPGEIAGLAIPVLQHQHVLDRARPAPARNASSSRGRSARTPRARSRITGGATRSPRPSGRLGPRRSEYGNTCRYDNGSALTRSSVASKSASLSPGKPTMASAPRPTPGWRRPGARPRAVHREVVRPPHETEDAIAAALERHVEVRHHRGRAGQHLDHRRSEKYAGSTDDSRSQRSPGTCTRRAQQRGQARARREVGAPVADVHAGQHDLRMPHVHQPAHFLRDHLARKAPTAAAGGGHDAEGAAVLAAVLDLDEGARAALDAARAGRTGTIRAAAMSPTRISARAALAEHVASRSGSRGLSALPTTRSTPPSLATPAASSAPSSRSPPPARRDCRGAPDGSPGDPRARRAP